jgi:hypothetical protein
MKRQTLLAPLFLGLLASSATAQHTKQYQDKQNHFTLTYPDSISPVILKANEDIKAQMDPFVIEVYVEKEATADAAKGKKVLVPMSPIPDDCFKFDKICKTKSGLHLKKFICSEGAAGKQYHSYIFMLEIKHRYILLKFMNTYSNVNADMGANPPVYDETKMTRWIVNIVDSLKLDK